MTMAVEPAQNDLPSIPHQTFTRFSGKTCLTRLENACPVLLLSLLLLGMHDSAALAETTAAADSFPETEIFPAQTRLTIDSQAQNRAGIRTLLLKPANYRPETGAYGEVLDILPLLKLRNHYFSALAEQRSARAALRLSAQHLARLRNLYRSKAAAQKKYLQQKMQWQNDQALLDAANYRLQGIEQTLLLHWGETLTGHATDPDSKLFRELLGQQHRLLSITLSAEQTNPSGAPRISVSPTGKRSQAVPADYLASSPRSDALTQGRSYFLLADSPLLQPPMHISAWITSPEPPLAGVIIPPSAVVRHLGQTFVYLQLDDATFVRRAIPRLITHEQGYFVPSGISAGDRLVIAGAQLLLAEEFRGQIPDEDDD